MVLKTVALSKAPIVLKEVMVVVAAVDRVVKDVLAHVLLLVCLIALLVVVEVVLVHVQDAKVIVQVLVRAIVLVHVALVAGDNVTVAGVALETAIQDVMVVQMVVKEAVMAPVRINAIQPVKINVKVLVKTLVQMHVLLAMVGVM